MHSFVLNSDKRHPDPSVQISLTFSGFEKGIVMIYSVLECCLNCVSSVGVTAGPFTDVISLQEVPARRGAAACMHSREHCEGYEPLDPSVAIAGQRFSPKEMK